MSAVTAGTVTVEFNDARYGPMVYRDGERLFDFEYVDHLSDKRRAKINDRARFPT